MITSFSGSNHDLDSHSAAELYAIEASSWLPTGTDALSAATLDEYEELVRTLAVGDGRDLGIGVHFAYRQHLMPLVAERGRELAASSPELAKEWELWTPSLGVLMEDPRGESDGMCRDADKARPSRRQALGWIGKVAAAVGIASLVGKASVDSAEASLCNCCKWVKSGTFFCYANWYEASNCSTFCYSRYVGQLGAAYQCYDYYGPCGRYP